MSRARCAQHSRNARRLLANPDLRDDVPFCLRRDTLDLMKPNCGTERFMRLFRKAPTLAELPGTRLFHSLNPCHSITFSEPSRGVWGRTSSRESNTALRQRRRARPIPIAC